MTAFVVIALIWVGVGGAALAFYLWLRERSRQEVVERAIADSGLGALRQRILRPDPDRPASERVEKLLQKAPSVWTENAGIREQLVSAHRRRSAAATPLATGVG
jgi:Flp pilus assembly protein TadB